MVEHISVIDQRTPGPQRLSNAATIAEYEINRANTARVGSAGPAVARGNAGGNARGNVGGNIAPKVRGWVEKLESVFQISNYASEDKVKYVVCNLHGRALTWWNGYVHSLGIDAANQIPWNELKEMMTAEYCPRSEVQKMEQELWNLTVKGDDIVGYTDRNSRDIQRNVTSFKPTTTHEAIRMAHNLMDQVVRVKATRGGDGNKQNWEDHQSNNINCNNNHHHQQNRRQEAVRAYAATPNKGKAYAGNLPFCNRCKLHHNGPCAVKCR
ncbi:putative reverse transcriptase domain-containing protein [Tanacetum coccineum]